MVVPSGSILRVRINQGMSSKNTAPGTTFDGVVLSDVIAGGLIAIPRGASFQGTVVDAHTAGQLSGKGELKLQLTNVSFGGKTYPVVTDFWWHQGADKTGNTVGNTVGLAGVGAVDWRYRRRRCWGCGWSRGWRCCRTGCLFGIGAG